MLIYPCRDIIVHNKTVKGSLVIIIFKDIVAELNGSCAESTRLVVVKLAECVHLSDFFFLLNMLFSVLYIVFKLTL